jgi:Right handed beta helix region
MLLSADMKLNCLFSILFFISFSGIAAAGDEVSINQQLQQGGVIHLQAGIYNIEGPIKIHSNTVLTGEPDTILRVSSSAGQWFVDGTGIIDNADTSLHDIEISNLEIDGNLKALPSSYANSGSGIHNAERAIDIRCDSGNFGSNISIHDLKIYDCYSDGIHIAFVNNVKVYNNFVSDCQHSGIYFISVLNGLMENNNVASITSDGLRFDNCVNNIFRNNILYSFTGDSNGAYQGGANFVQVSNQGRSHGGGSDKPTSTKNIEGYGNVFSSGGLRDIWIDSTGKGVENVYVHDNKGTTVTTSGTPVTGIDFANISFRNPPTTEMSEKIFNYIFDALNLKYADSGFTNQTAEEIQYSVKQTEQGAIAGGITMIGFSNVVTIDGVNSIPDNNSILVKSAAVKAPSFTFVTGVASNIKC